MKGVSAWNFDLGALKAEAERETDPDLPPIPEATVTGAWLGPRPFLPNHRLLAQRNTLIKPSVLERFFQLQCFLRLVPVDVRVQKDWQPRGTAEPNRVS